jgi:SnoaL-like domain
MDDWNKIADRIGALAVHIDARRWDDLLELFAPEVLADWTSLFGGEPQSLKGEQLIANWRQLLPGFTRTTHLVGPPTIVVTGESHRPPPPSSLGISSRSPDWKETISGLPADAMRSPSRNVTVSGASTR